MTYLNLIVDGNVMCTFMITTSAALKSPQGFSVVNNKNKSISIYLYARAPREINFYLMYNMHISWWKD